ncbi:MAG TPA: hypothetical protein VN706_10405 [Gemmatimonadaceae bacterium]|nr:hypothetical protein [Gemmatimonadaceae bacterium]
MKSIHRLASFASASLLVLAASACNQDLTVDNTTNPDVLRVFALPSGIEGTIASSFQSVHNAIHHTNDPALYQQALSLGLESYSSLNNFLNGPRVDIPRSPIANQNGSSTIFSEFSSLERAARLDANALDALARLIEDQKSTLGSDAQNLRARAMGFFGMGVATGWLSIIYDSAGIVGPRMPSDSIPPLSGAKEVAAAALAYLDSAYAYANNATASATGGFPTPTGTSWFGNVGLSADQFKRLTRSYKAVFRAGVARTPAERNAVDWSQVIADAENGIQSDLMVTVGSTSGWSLGYISTMYQDATWSELSMMYLGMADTSGAYASFIATPITTRDGSKLIVQTPDKRWPAGADRKTQQGNSSASPANASTKPYIGNRTLADPSGAGWGISNYDYYRYKYIRNNSQTGLYPELMKAEIDLLAAEGYIRKGDIASAAAKIDLTRVPNGLEKLSGVVTSATQAVPGGSHCVPEVPSPDGTVSCGNIMEAMKYEKRIETAFSSFGRWWQDSRGWGDLITNTAYEYPVPYQEMQARQSRFYSLGGGLPSSATKGTYGF